MRREARVDRALEALHVEEHVDRDDDDEDGREEQEDERERRSLREPDRVLRVARDLAGTQPVEPLVDLLRAPNVLETVVVEPDLQAVEIDLCRRLPGVELVGDVLVDAVGGVPRLVEGDDADRDEERDHDGHEDRVDDEDGRPARHLQARQVADERD